jgi:hypothetical protein
MDDIFAILFCCLVCCDEDAPINNSANDYNRLNNDNINNNKIKRN